MHDNEYDEFAYDEFEAPGTNSALRRATRNNPRNLPCPTCERPNMLTPRDRELGYQCDACADALEEGSYYGRYGSSNY